MPDLSHPAEPGLWTLLQQRSDHAMWQQDQRDASGAEITRFWVVNPPEQLMYDTFDEAEAIFEDLAND